MDQEIISKVIHEYIKAGSSYCNCGSKESCVKETIKTDEYIIRIRQCKTCQNRFLTVEIKRGNLL